MDFRRFGLWGPALGVLGIGALLAILLTFVARSEARTLALAQSDQTAELVYSRVETVVTGMIDLAAAAALGDEPLSQADFDRYIQRSRLQDLTTFGAFGIVEKLPRSQLPALIERERAAGRANFFVLTSPLIVEGDALVLTRFAVADQTVEIPELGVDLSMISESASELEAAREPRSVLVQDFNFESVSGLLRAIGSEELATVLEYDLTVVTPSRFRDDGAPIAWAVGLSDSAAIANRLPVPTGGGVAVDMIVDGKSRSIASVGDMGAFGKESLRSQGRVDWRVTVHTSPKPEMTTVYGVLLFALLTAALTGLVSWLRHRIDQESREKERLEKLAETDALTGLSNRAALRRLSAASDENERVGLILGDLDGFKPVNDDLGHHAGDHVLRVIASRMCKAVRPHDAVLRWGGDEFLVVLRDLQDDLEAERVRARLESAVQAPIAWQGRELQVSMSTGLVVAQPAGDLHDLVERADRRMYEAKAKRPGRPQTAS